MATQPRSGDSSDIQAYEPIGWVGVSDQETVREALEQTPAFERVTDATYRSADGSVEAAFVTRADGSEAVEYRPAKIGSPGSVSGAARELVRALSRDEDFYDGFEEDVMRDIGYGAAARISDEERSEAVMEEFGLTEDPLEQRVATDGGVDRTMADVDHESPYDDDPVQGTFEGEGSPDVYTDGGRTSDFPNYVGTGPVEPSPDRHDTESMGDLTRR